MSCQLVLPNTAPARSGTFLGRRCSANRCVFTEEERRMRHGACRRERCRSKLVKVTEGILRHDEGGSSRPPLEVKAERHRQGRAIVAADATRKPIGFLLVQISHIYCRVIDKPPAHATCGIRLAFQLLQPRRWVLSRISWPEVRDDVRKSGMMHSKQDRRVLVFDEAFHVAFHLNYNTAIVEHAERANDGASLSHVVGYGQAGLRCSNACCGHKL